MQIFSTDPRQARRIYLQLLENNLLTNSRTNRAIGDDLRKDLPENKEIKFILTRGRPVDYHECSECRRDLPPEYYSYFQTRVDNKGYLMRSNSLCSDCRNRLDNERKIIFEREKDKIPPTPEPGEICPRCNRPWHGRWHRDHDYKTEKFIGWKCNNCNMLQSDRRTPNPFNQPTN